MQLSCGLLVARGSSDLLRKHLRGIFRRSLKFGVASSQVDDVPKDGCHKRKKSPRSIRKNSLANGTHNLPLLLDLIDNLTPGKHSILYIRCKYLLKIALLYILKG